MHLLDLVTTHLDGDAARAAWLIARGAVWVGIYRVRDPDIAVAPDAEVNIHLPPSGRYAEVVFDPSWILFEDDDLIVLNKPPGVYVDVTPWDAEAHLRGALEQWLAVRDGAPPQLHLAHRLDRDTTGVLLISKTPELNVALQRAFVGRKVHKQYLALCSGSPAWEDMELTTGHGRSKHGRFRVYTEAEIGMELPNGSRVKAMQTRLHAERRLEEGTLVAAWPITGRTHQIRLHLAYLGHPIYGDATYGGPLERGGAALEHHLLHAARLELPHPRSYFPMVFTAPLPAWAS